MYKKKHVNLKINCSSSLWLLCVPAALGSPEDQAGKCSISHIVSVNCTSIHSSLCCWQHEDDAMLSARRPSFILTQERRSSCHFECQVRPQMKIFAELVDFHFVLLHWNSFLRCAGYVPFGTPIVSPIWKSYILNHGCADVHLHGVCVWGQMKWDFGLILPQK